MKKRPGAFYCAALIGAILGITAQNSLAAATSNPRIEITIEHVPQPNGNHHRDVKLTYDVTVDEHATNQVIQWKGRKPFSIVLPQVSKLEWNTRAGKTNNSPGLFNTNSTVIIDSDSNFHVEIEITMHPGTNTIYQLAVG